MLTHGLFFLPEKKKSQQGKGHSEYFSIIFSATSNARPLC